ncbi:FAD-dependent oxidoreductase [Aquisalimonas lutea]|uniref:NAD(P)/FAD-dependent oxidoreductase n=1 Tax=Aquisalimonas lutea TaxID=1327750 RepID=UPI0025B4F9C7|nr:FAD-dependent oxidoreductase [Aquisalimonas lutea]MDN3518108.1 FAD-dependent oxidoreductase [Aquisalimonas lutea]
MSHTVIIGAGHGGIQVADALRTISGEGKITVLSAEPHIPYQRPPLSKEFLSGESHEPPLPLRGQTFYSERGINSKFSTHVTEVSTSSRQIRTADGGVFSYTDLVFATGARNRRLDVDGAELQGVYYLRDLDDALSLRSALADARRAVVIGAGFIGLEFAAVARQRGLDVTVLEMGDRPMARATSAIVSEYIVTAHEHAGVKLRFREGVACIHGENGGVSSVSSTDGKEYPADLVLVGIGVVPNTEVAADSGVAVDDGIIVNEYLEASEPNIWAVGDCSRFPNPLSGDPIRIESVQNATDQAKCVAANIAARKAEKRYEEIPWFWSYQGRLKIQIVGHVQFASKFIVRGEIEERRFSVFGFKNDILTSVESINFPAHHMAARRIMTMGLSLTPGKAADPNFPLKEFSFNEKKKRQTENDSGT